MTGGSREQGRGTAYEEQRRENIRRNRDRMKRLGVEGVIPERGDADRSAGKKKRRDRDQGLALPVRQSARLRNVPAVSYTLPDEEHLEDLERVRKRVRKQNAVTGGNRIPKREKVTPPAPSPDSCRALSIDKEYWGDSELVGRKLVPSNGLGPKAFIMASLRGASNGRLAPPKFSKYSGIQEWANAVVLFVNVSSKGGQQAYDNLFLDNFGRMTWFAQKYHVEETPVVQRLLKLTKREGGNGERDPVLLFCRREGEAYVFGGQLQLDQFFPETRPLKFIWTLPERLSASKEFLDIVET
ncbi:hypothetical protein HOP50_05g39600 [Chloropicon primus]|nr:hypothetical protein HOP50_05g39600 [Chloropicon primus]|mmetsp:Transcript_9547/g.27158  ORF Transcript_9547/g.27158 Transcript_9547/m.27158 type:complete len:298 (+) Transcript_9547:134-1027(+)